MPRVVVATRSAHKLREIRQMLAPFPQIELLDLNDAGVPEDPAEEAIEQFDTFEENARAKARYFAERTGALVLADDSGICVDALGGAPGVRSKRFSGRSDLSGPDLDRANNDLLLERLRDVPPPKRTAHYVCCAALQGEGREAVCTGTCHGIVLREPRGEGGFGYDPLFLVDGEDVTFGELPPDARLVTNGSEFRYNADHQWWYFPDMTRDEVLFFVFNDTDHGRPWRVVHSAFRDPTAAATVPRHSIEFRTFAFFR